VKALLPALAPASSLPLLSTSPASVPLRQHIQRCGHPHPHAPFHADDDGGGDLSPIADQHG
jgi:hypothetical protein